MAGQDPGSPEMYDGKEMVGNIIVLKQGSDQESQLFQGSGVGLDPCSVEGGNFCVFQSGLPLQCLSHF